MKATEIQPLSALTRALDIIGAGVTEALSRGVTPEELYATVYVGTTLNFPEAPQLLSELYAACTVRAAEARFANQSMAFN